MMPWWSMNETAWSGFNASKTSGCRTIAGIAAIAITANQIHMTGPKKAAIRAVPRDCAANNAARISTMSGTT